MFIEEVTHTKLSTGTKINKSNINKSSKNDKKVKGVQR